MEQRLQKLIAAAGVASRRHAEELIAAGKVTVNGEVIKELGSKADPDNGSWATVMACRFTIQKKLSYSCCSATQLRSAPR